MILHDIPSGDRLGGVGYRTFAENISLDCLLLRQVIQSPGYKYNIEGAHNSAVFGYFILLSGKYFGSLKYF